MSTKFETPDKPSLTRGKLALHRIFFDTEICWSDGQDESKVACRLRESYPHVEALRTALLNLGGVIPDERQSMLQEDYQKFTTGWSAEEKACREKWSLLAPSSASWNPRDYSPQCDRERRTSAENEIAKCAEIAHYARKRADNVEAGWTSFLRRYIFTEFESPDNNRTPYESTFDKWTIEENVPWNEHGRRTGEGVTLTGPKPDLTYAFPVSRPSDSLLPGFAELDCVQNFSYDTLKELRREDSANLKSTLTTGLHKARESAKGRGLLVSDLMCFPWAVVEVKHGNVKQDPEMFCYCQVANALSTALGMHEALFSKAFGLVPHDLSPLVGFTCIGPELKVWLLYIERGPATKLYRMVCIWATDLQLTWGVYSTRLIIQNMHVWASRILRPRVSNCLSLLMSKDVLATPSFQATTPRSEPGMSPEEETPCPSEKHPRSSLDARKESAPPPPDGVKPRTVYAPSSSNVKDKSYDRTEASAYNALPPTAVSLPKQSPDLEIGLARLSINKDSTEDSEHKPNTESAGTQNATPVPSLSLHDLKLKKMIDAILNLRDPLYFRRNDLILPATLTEAMAENDYDSESDGENVGSLMASMEPYHNRLQRGEYPKLGKYSKHDITDDHVGFREGDSSADDTEDENYRTPLIDDSEEETDDGTDDSSSSNASKDEEDDLAEDDDVATMDDAHASDDNEHDESEDLIVTDHCDGHEADDWSTESSEGYSEDQDSHSNEEDERERISEKSCNDEESPEPSSSQHASSQESDSRDEQRKSLEILTRRDVAQIAWDALKAMDSSSITNLHLLRVALARLSDSALYQSICCLMFVREPADILPQFDERYDRSNWEPHDKDRLEAVCYMLNAALKLGGTTSHVITMNGGRIQSFLVRYALRLLVEHQKSLQLREILRASLSVLPGYSVVDILSTADFPLKASEWCEIKAIALERVMED